MKNLLLLIVLALSLAPGVYAEQLSPQPLRVGLILPLSGPLASHGTDILRGILMAVAEQDDSVKIFTEDSRYDLRTAAAAAQKLISVDRVNVLVSLWDTADVVAPLAQRQGILHLAIRWNYKIAEQFSNTFTFESTYEDYGAATVALADRLGFKQIALASADTSSWNLVEPVQTAEIRTRSLTLTDSVFYPADTADFKAIALKLAASKAQVVIINDIGSEMQQLARHLLAYNPQIQLIAQPVSAQERALLEGFYFVDQLNTSKQFRQRFREKYKEDLKFRAQLGYDLINILLSVRQTSVFDIEAIKLGLMQVHEYQGVSGMIRPRHNGKVFQTEVTVRRILDGEVIPAAFKH